MRWPWNRPATIVLGVGEVIVGTGEKFGTPFVFLRPVKVRGLFGQKLPDQTITTKRGDVVLWIEHPDGAAALADTLLRATTARSTERPDPPREASKSNGKPEGGK